MRQGDNYEHRCSMCRMAARRQQLRGLAPRPLMRSEGRAPSGLQVSRQDVVQPLGHVFESRILVTIFVDQS